MKKYFFLLLLVFGCSHTPSKKNSHPLVLVSVDPYVTMVKEITGDLIDVRCVLPSSVDPHNWEPTLKDLSGYEHALLWFTIGEGFEYPLLKALRSSQPNLENISLAAPPVVRLGSVCEHENHDHCTGYDTHFWLDPITDISQAEIITETLSEKFPDHAAQFQENFAALTKKLVELDYTIATTLIPVKGKIIVTSHGAYTYFCHRYDLRQFVIEPQEGKEPRPKDLTNIVSALKQEPDQIIAIFTQPQHSNKTAKTLSQELHKPIISIDPYNQNYIETIRSLEKACLSSN